MTVELENTVPETEQPSTVLTEEVTTPKPSGMKLEEPEKKAEKPLSVDEAVRKAAEEANAPKETKPEPKSKVEAKEPVKEEKPAVERGEGGKFKAREPEETQETSEGKTEEAEAGRDGETTRPSEGREDQPPARFLPRAKEAWHAAPPELRSEVKRMEAEFEKGRELFEEDRGFRKELREFEDMAKEHGTTVKAALSNYVAIDNLLRTNAEEGLERVLKSIGLTPQQYANHILNSPQKPPVDPTVSRLEQQLQQVTQQLQQVTNATQEEQRRASIQHIDNTLFNEVRKEHPRFDELKPDIALFWNSDKLSSITDERQRLFAAVDMAERINPTGYSQQNTERLKPAPDDRPLNPAGRKSIRGAPSAGTSFKPNSAIVSIEDAVKAAMADR